MDYSKLSDFEINKRIAEREGVRGFHCENVGGGSALKFSNWKELDYCNNAADAWPIILCNRITLMPASKSDKWMAQVFDHAIADVSTNPLRSAMIVYLMMRESE